MGIKIFKPSGIDQKSSDLTRRIDSLRDAQNIQYNEFGEYVKRPGTSVDADFSGDTYSDVIFIKSLGEYFFRDGSTYSVYKNGVKRSLPVPVVDPTTEPTSNISGAEYLNTFIFTHEEGQVATYKYDGNSVYMAGLPVPNITVSQSGAATTGFMLNFFDFIDGRGNQIFGPAIITEISNVSLAITVSTFNSEGFYNGYLTVPNGNQTIDSSSRTLTYDAISSDIVVGSKLPFRKNVHSGAIAITINSPVALDREAYMMLEVESIDTTLKQITFTAASFGTKSIAISNGGPAQNCLGSLVLRTFFSASEFTGYVESDTTAPIIDNSALVIPGISSAYSVAGEKLLSNIYDLGTDKLRPPRCKYIQAYGYQLVYGGVLSFWDFDNKETNYTNNDLIMYSDISTGDLGENLTASNRQLIGDTYDGEITGMCRSKDSLIVLKTRSPYALDGVLVPGQYTMRKIETDDIGCVSAKSIISVDGTTLFQGQDGIYGINGYSCKKVSTPIDVFFKSTVTDKTQTRAALYTNGEKYLFFCDNGVAVFDYEYGQWFIWKQISAPKGVTIDNDGELRMFRDTQAYKFNAILSDSGAAIDAWIKPAWFDMGEPSAVKKATDIRFFAINNKGQTLQLTTYVDWSETNGKAKGPYPVDFSDADTKTVLKKLDIQQGQSISFKLSNAVVGEDLNLTGFEITTDVWQTKDKNVK